MLLGSLGSQWAKEADALLALLVVGHVLEERLYARGSEEHQHIVRGNLLRGDLHAHCAVHHGWSNLELRLCECRYLVFVNLGNGHQEFLGVVLLHYQCQVLNLARLGVMHLALAEDDELLQIKGHCLGLAEVLHLLIGLGAKFLGKFEEMVDCRLRGEDDGSEVGDADFLCPELFRTKRFDANEWLERK